MSNWEQTGDVSVQLSVDDALEWDENFYHPRVGGETVVDELEQRGTLTKGDTERGQLRGQGSRARAGLIGHCPADCVERPGIRALFDAGRKTRANS